MSSITRIAVTTLVASLRRAPAAAAFALACLLAAGASAQHCTVTVTVTDDAGAAQSFTDVRVEGADGNPNSFADITDENGQFRFVGVPAGKYAVSATTEGLASDSYTIDLAPGAVQAVKVVLKRYSAKEEIVEVNAQLAELVDVLDVSVKSEISGEFISKTPLQNRRIQDIVAMMPGVIRSGSSDSTDISIGGGTSAQIAYRIDGLSGNDVVDGGLALQIPTAAIQSFKLITAGASARYGEQSTGIAEIVTKSGRNENDFAYEVQYRDTEYGAQGIPDLDEANKAVDDLLNATGSNLEQEVREGFLLLGVDPLSTTDDDNNPVPRRRIRHTVSAGGPIKRDAAYFHTTLESLQDDYGSPFVQGTAQNDQLLWTSKVNWNIWKDADGQASNRLEFTSNVDVSDDTGFIGLTAPRSLNTIGSAGAWTLGLTDTHVTNDLAVFETKLSLVHQYSKQRPEDVREGVGTQYQIPLPPGGPISYNVGQAGSDFDQTVSTVRTEVNYSKAVGTRDQHTLDMGFNGDQTVFNLYQEIGTQVTDLRVVDDTGLLAGVGPSPGREITYGPAVRTEDEAWYAAFYASDSWRVTDHFTLQTGIRAEYQSFVGEIFLAPRVGFSLDPIGDGKTRFFGNWGLYYDRLFANFLQFTQFPDRTWRTIEFAPQFAGQQRNFSETSIVDIYKEAQSTAINSPAGDAVAWLEPEIIDRFVSASSVTAPTNKDWTIGISRQFPGKLRLEVAYRANSRTHQIQTDTVVRAVPEFTGYTYRDIVYGTTGKGAFRQWSAEISRPFSDLWSMQLSYVQSKNTGPIGPPQNPIDPNDVEFVNGTLGNDRTHVVKMQGNTKIGKGKGAVDASVDFTWQTGLPTTASITRSSGARLEPIGRNSLRLPSTRQLNFGLQKSFQVNTKEGGGFLPTIGFRAQIFNVLNELNVTAALARFETPEGTSTPDSFPPLRPTLITTGVDVSRSLEVGFSISF